MVIKTLKFFEQAKNTFDDYCGKWKAYSFGDVRDSVLSFILPIVAVPIVAAAVGEAIKLGKAEYEKAKKEGKI